MLKMLIEKQLLWKSTMHNVAQVFCFTLPGFNFISKTIILSTQEFPGK